MYIIIIFLCLIHVYNIEFWSGVKCLSTSYIKRFVMYISALLMTRRWQTLQHPDIRFLIKFTQEVLIKYQNSEFLYKIINYT